MQNQGVTGDKARLGCISLKDVWTRSDETTPDDTT